MEEATLNCPHIFACLWGPPTPLWVWGKMCCIIASFKVGGVEMDLERQDSWIVDPLLEEKRGARIREGDHPRIPGSFPHQEPGRNSVCLPPTVLCVFSLLVAKAVVKSHPG